MLERYFKILLKDRGFPDVDHVYWSLSYSQGDGCSFTGSFSTKDSLALMDKMYSAPDHNAIERVSNLIKRRTFGQCLKELDYNVSIAGRNNHYCHEETMYADYQVAPGDDEDTDLMDSIEEFTKDVLSHAKDAARAMRHDGYSLIESFNQAESLVWKFRTRHYEIKLHEIEMSPDDMNMEDWENDVLFWETCQSLLSGRTRITGLRAEVFYYEHPLESEPELLISETSWPIEIDARSKFYNGQRSFLVRSILNEIIPKKSRREARKLRVSKAA